MIKLNLGCGKLQKEGYLNVDSNIRCEPDMLWDLSLPWPWEDDSVEEIIALDIIEHLQNAVYFIEEAHRVLKPRGNLILKTVHWQSRNFPTDPTHIRAFTEQSFDYFDPSTMLGQNYGFYSDAKFEIMERDMTKTGDIRFRMVKLNGA